MRYAIISDIHANAQAWEAVYKDIRTIGVDAIICLGDIVGYGPRPEPVLESVLSHSDAIVLGNHEAVIGGRFDANCFSDEARLVIDWTREQLTDQAIKYFAELPTILEIDDFTVTHAEVADPERFNYIDSAELARESFDTCGTKLTFVGHTHCPAIFSLNTDDGKVRTHLPLDFSPLDGVRYIVNAGSIGDPRGGDVKAVYCLYDMDKNTISFRKVAFNIEAYRDNLLESGLNIHPFFLSQLPAVPVAMPINDGTGSEPVAPVAMPVDERSWKSFASSASKQPKIRVDRGIMSFLRQTKKEKPVPSPVLSAPLPTLKDSASLKTLTLKMDEGKRQKLEQFQQRQNEKAALRQQQEQQDLQTQQELERKKKENQRKLEEAAIARAVGKQQKEIERKAVVQQLLDEKRQAALRAKDGNKTSQ